MAAALSLTVGLPTPAGAQAAPTSAAPAPTACGVSRSLRLQAGALNDLGITGGSDAQGRAALGWFGLTFPVPGLDGTGAVTALSGWTYAAGSAADADGGKGAFRWSLFGGTQRLSSAGGNQKVAAVNGGGDVLFSDNGAQVWRRKGEVARLGVSPLGGDVHAMDINDAGVAVGYVHRSTPYYTYSTDGLVWGRDGALVEIPSLVAYTDTTVPDNDGMVLPAAVDGAGRVYGTAIDESNHTVAFRWTAEGGMQVLGRVGDWMRVFDANDRGDLVGTYSINGESTDRVFVYTAEGGFRDLGITDMAEVGAVDDRSGPQRFSINDFGVVAGSYPVAGGDGTPTSVLWSPRRCPAGR